MMQFVAGLGASAPAEGGAASVGSGRKKPYIATGPVSRGPRGEGKASLALVVSPLALAKFL